MIDLPVYYMPMPVNSDGDGPAFGTEVARVIHEVWDPHCNTICVAPTREMANLVVRAVNEYFTQQD